MQKLLIFHRNPTTEAKIQDFNNYMCLKRNLTFAAAVITYAWFPASPFCPSISFCNVKDRD